MCSKAPSPGGHAPITTSRRRWVIGAAGGLLGVVLVLEMLVRFLVMGPGPLFVHDPDIRRLPAKGTRVFWATEGHGRTRYSDDGEIATPFSGGPSVVVLGDSHTEGLHVDDAAKFVSVAEASLHHRGRHVDLRNLGFAGGTVADYIRLAPTVIARYHPVAVVVQITTDDFGAKSFDQGRVNYFVRETDGSLRLHHRDDPRRSPTLAERVKHVSALLNYLRMRVFWMAERRALASAPPVGGRAPEASSDTPAATDTASAQLRLLRRAYAGVPLILLVLPSAPSIDGRGIVTVEPRYERLLQAIRSSLDGAPDWQLVDLLPAFVDLARRGTLPRGFPNTRPGVGHLNAGGHLVVGQRLADALEALGP